MLRWSVLGLARRTHPSLIIARSRPGGSPSSGAFLRTWTTSTLAAAARASAPASLLCAARGGSSVTRRRRSAAGASAQGKAAAVAGRANPLYDGAEKDGVALGDGDNDHDDEAEVEAESATDKMRDILSRNRSTDLMEADSTTPARYRADMVEEEAAYDDAETEPDEEASPRLGRSRGRQGGRTPASVDLDGEEGMGGEDALDDAEGGEGDEEIAEREERLAWRAGGKGGGGGDDPKNTAERNASSGAGAAGSGVDSVGDALDSKYITDVYPELAAEYEAAGAANTVPVEEVRTDSATVAAWRCPRCAQVWKSGVFVRCVLKNDCPTCTAARHPTVAAKRPDLVQVWDTTRNDPFLTPEECPADSGKTVHWLCPTCNQSFPARVKDRVLNKSLCPSCAMLHMQSADVLAQEESALLQEWHPLKNGDLRLDQVQPTNTKTKIWWLCSVCGHDWEASLAARLSRKRRTKGSVCPACHGKGSASGDL